MDVKFQTNLSNKQMLLTRKILQYLSLEPILDVLTTMLTDGFSSTKWYLQEITALQLHITDVTVTLQKGVPDD